MNERENILNNISYVFFIFILLSNLLVRSKCTNYTNIVYYIIMIRNIVTSKFIKLVPMILNDDTLLGKHDIFISTFRGTNF